MRPKAATKSKIPGNIPEEFCELRLYVAGQTPKSKIAPVNLNRICRKHLSGLYHIEVIDLLKKTQMAKQDQILPIPTLVRKLPCSSRKIIGDFTDVERVLIGLGLHPRN